MPDSSENIDKNTPPRRPNPSPWGGASIWWFLVLLALVVVAVYYIKSQNNRSEITYGFFRSQLETDKNIATAEIQGDKLYGEFTVPPIDPDAKPGADGTTPKLNKKFVVILPPMALADPKLDEVLRDRLGQHYRATEPRDNTVLILMFYMLISVGLFVGLWVLFRKARDSFFSGGLTGGFSKSGARRYDGGDKPITFDDVAGLEGVKHELQEVVEFLRNPAKFQRLGARVPKGILLMGAARHRQDPAGPRRGRRGGRAFLSRSTAPSSSRCSSAWARAGSATCSRPPRTTPRRSSSSTKSTPSAGTAARAWAAVTTNASRR